MQSVYIVTVTEKRFISMSMLLTERFFVNVTTRKVFNYVNVTERKAYNVNVTTWKVFCQCHGKKGL